MFLLAQNVRGNGGEQLLMQGSPIYGLRPGTRLWALGEWATKMAGQGVHVWTCIPPTRACARLHTCTGTLACVRAICACMNSPLALGCVCMARLCMCEWALAATGYMAVCACAQRQRMRERGC